MVEHYFQIILAMFAETMSKLRLYFGVLRVSRLWYVNGVFYQREAGLESKELLGTHSEPNVDRLVNTTIRRQYAIL